MSEGRVVTSVEALEALPVGSVVTVEIVWGDGSGALRDDVFKYADGWRFTTPDHPEKLTSRGLFHYHLVDNEDQWTIRLA